MGAPVQGLATRGKESVTQVSANPKRHGRHLFSNKLFKFYFYSAFLRFASCLDL